MGWMFWVALIGICLVIIFMIKLVHMKHKIYAVLIVLILMFLYVSGSQMIESGNIDISTGEGVLQAAKMYITWIGHLAENTKSLAGKAIQMDWEGDLNSTS